MWTKYITSLTQNTTHRVHGSVHCHSHVKDTKEQNSENSASIATCSHSSTGCRGQTLSPRVHNSHSSEKKLHFSFWEGIFCSFCTREGLHGTWRSASVPADTKGPKGRDAAVGYFQAGLTTRCSDFLSVTEPPNQTAMEEVSSPPHTAKRRSGPQGHQCRWAQTHSVQNTHYTHLFLLMSNLPKMWWQTLMISHNNTQILSSFTQHQKIFRHSIKTTGDSQKHFSVGSLQSSLRQRCSYTFWPYGGSVSQYSKGHGTGSPRFESWNQDKSKGFRKIFQLVKWQSSESGFTSNPPWPLGANTKTNRIFSSQQCSIGPVNFTSLNHIAAYNGGVSFINTYNCRTLAKCMLNN